MERDETLLAAERIDELRGGVMPRSNELFLELRRTERDEFCGKLKLFN